MTEPPARPWLRSYPPGIEWDARFPAHPVTRFLDDAVERFAERPCLDFLGKVSTYHEIGDLVRRAPKGMLYRALKRADQADVPMDEAHVAFANLVDNDGAFEPPAVDALRDVAVLQYTGGTTGTPKGAMLSHANLVANVRQCMAWFPDFKPGEERALAVLPFFHVFAMTVVMNLSIAVGAEIVLLA